MEKLYMELVVENLDLTFIKGGVYMHQNGRN